METLANSNKRMKEEFVSNLTGTSMLEIAALFAIVPALVVLRQWTTSFPGKSKQETKKDDDVVVRGRNWKPFAAALGLDYLCVVLPILLFFTVLAEWAMICAGLLMLLMILCISAKWCWSTGVSKKEDAQIVLRMNILSYRVLVVMVTCICILAVDFKIYPRRYAKTETFGTGLMDLGVGSFVLANSLVSRQARTALSMNWKDAMKSICPLVVLGFGRLISTTGVDYQVHVGEYGVHWNFFFTLAAVSVLTCVINIHPRYCGTFGSIILIVYQVCLICGLSDYLISNERTSSLVNQNKEGLFSIFGYWGLYLMGVHLGFRIFFANDSPTRMRTSQRARTRVWILAVLFWLITIILDKHVEQVSRRTCNLAYVTFVLATNFEALGILMLSDFISGQKPLVLEEAFNQNLLGSFLLANVFTGMVNLSVDTIAASSFTAFGIMVGYTFLLSAVVGVALFYGIRFKYW